MLRRYTLLASGLFLGGICLSLTPGYSNNYSSSYSSSQLAQSSIFDSEEEPPQFREATGREEIAYMDERDIDIHQRANRKGDWDYKQNWRYDREAFYRGETQGEAYNQEHPTGTGGPGMDSDTEYLHMRNYYLQQERNRQSRANNPGSQNSRAYVNQQTQGYRANNPDQQQISDLSRRYSQPSYPSNERNDYPH